ncbi:MAG TPA: aspartate aminotransferase [Marinilabiliales bacterium]|jgi:aspartate aminotransferase|nr:MAG: aspartate aminotransferase [Bacteroidetes bacterium GWA2_40_14]OFX62788.1 MAG: aspartate aminotransferase [Bacteroidetes bacterium GWC2_40_13]OFX72129.1 MAG: aspartate aminotransferase [Bacteroidetes bacterium GWD2_40_43]OFX92515.1 MAG: aspartate aminotransferase [Bacteroidetes bacterium GWE2_40_63]OFY16453.1 MAG: aspartate aminotransferase [Bacteroidetes bacterium GWF2_40_13]OFZ27194.1 MAG: aspartate aminotransferase [Bacteroidetes bacterium RIFOXYC2_FULL_40_12]HAM97864.1 aspartate a
MPQISIKGTQMPASPIRKLVPFAEEAKRKGRKVYHLNIGQPDIKTPEVALNAVRNITDKVIEYSHSAGNESYRRKLAGYYQNLGIDVQFSDILITTGGSEALLFAFQSTLNAGDEVIIPEPFYANYNAFAVMAGVKMVPVTASIHDGFALPPIEKFEELIHEKTKGIMVCNPSNPTGYLYSEQELRKLADIAKKHDLYIYSDEVYREFCYDGNRHFSAMLLEDIQQNVIMVDSVSKRYSSCGTRIGALVSKNCEVISTALKFAQARLSPPSFGQIAAEASLDTPKEYFDEVYDEYIARRDYTVEALNKMEGVICPKPKGAFYTIVKLPIDDSEKFCQWILSDFEYNNQTVMMAPASGFYSTKGKGYNEVRIAYVLKIEDLKKAMETLEKALLAYPGRTL